MSMSRDIIFHETRPNLFLLFFFLNDPAPPEISTLPLHDALPISSSVVSPVRRNDIGWQGGARRQARDDRRTGGQAPRRVQRSPHFSLVRRTEKKSFEGRSEEHTSELQSQSNLVCRLLLEKKKIRH